MPMSTLDPRSALVVIDMQKGILRMPAAHPASEIVQRANLADDPDADRHSVEKIFPRLGETATTAEILPVLGT